MSKLNFENNDKIKEVQTAKLHSQLQFIATKSPYYHQLFSANNIAIESIKTIEDVKKIPPHIERRFCKQYSRFLLCF
jgi:phenylacetate-coenzyme A ligase PaaK-like adenylate-forming protein